MIWATVNSWSCFCWLYRASPSLAAKNIINLISVSTIGSCPCIESSLVLLEEGVCYDQCIFLAKKTDGETVETVSDFILGGSKITADGNCSHEIKRCLLLGRKVMSNLDSIFKSRDITLPTKFHLVKAMVFPVVMYGCESWTLKKAECWRIDAFELWCWRRLLRALDCKEIQTVHSEGDQPWDFFERNDAEAETKDIREECGEEAVKGFARIFNMMGKYKSSGAGRW